VDLIPEVLVIVHREGESPNLPSEEDRLEKTEVEVVEEASELQIEAAEPAETETLTE
jgi:hypothetical protein